MVAKVVIVTGVAHGIGKATALRLADSGWHVVGVDVEEPGYTHPAVFPVVMDLTDAEAVSDVVQVTAAQ